MSITVDQATDDRMIPTPPRTDGDIIRDALEDLGKQQIWLIDQIAKAGYNDGQPMSKPALSMILRGHRPVPRLLRVYLNRILDIDLPRRPR